MFLLLLVLIPLIGIFILLAALTYNITGRNTKLLKITALTVTIVDLIISLIIYILFDCSSKQFQFVQEHYELSYFDFYLGVDGLSIYFVLLTTIIIPISIISNWKSIKENTIIFLIIILLLETSLLIVFLVLDILLFYIFFESILAPLFILIGLYGSNEKVRASFYFFLYTLLGSLFMLLSIITMLSLIGSTDFDVLSKTNFLYTTQLFLFYGIFIAFAVKTPIIYLNSWLLKAHVESPLSGSIILAGIVLKLSLYGILRLILPLLPKAFIYYTYIVFLIGVLTIIYASLSTLRTIDVKELIAYSSVSHAAVYLIGLFSNTLHGIEGGITLGLAHGFVSSGLFICAGGVLYDRSSTRLITYYRGIAQIMPIFSILFFILSLGNCGVPLTLNFLGEFMSLYGVFERLPLAGALASLSIIFSAAYTIFMFNRIAFAGSFFLYFWENYIPDLNKREFNILLALVLFTVIFGIYPAVILDGLHYSTYSVLFTLDSLTNANITKYDTLEPWGLFFQDNATPQMEALEELHNNIMFYLAIIMITITYILIYALLTYKVNILNTIYKKILNTRAMLSSPFFLGWMTENHYYNRSNNKFKDLMEQYSQHTPGDKYYTHLQLKKIIEQLLPPLEKNLTQRKLLPNDFKKNVEDLGACINIDFKTYYPEAMHDPNKLYYLLRRLYEDEINDIINISIERNYKYNILVREKLSIHEHDTLPIISEASEISRVNVMENIPTRAGSKHVTYDSCEPWLIFFQDNHKSEALLNYNIVFYLVLVIFVLVSMWIFVLVNTKK